MRVPTLLLAVAASAALCGAASRPPAHVDVAIETSLGTFVVRLDGAHAPVTTANFLRYVDSGTYDGATFYRSVRATPGAPPPRIQIIQGGLEQKMDVSRLPAIPVEPTATTHLHNAPGTIAMARTNDPNSARTEFFVNLADDTWLDSQNFPDHEGYAVFGRVIRGYDIAKKIQSAPAQANASGEALTPPVKILHIRRVR
jgi:peptidyl-prolyl cis-trans isomerase A (cyclophilin A)